MQSSHWFFSCSQKAQGAAQLHKPKGMLQQLANTLFDQLAVCGKRIGSSVIVVCPKSLGDILAAPATQRITQSRDGVVAVTTRAFLVPLLYFYAPQLGLFFQLLTMSSSFSNINKLNPFSQQKCCILSNQTWGNLIAEQNWNMGSVSQQILHTAYSRPCFQLT